MRKNTSQGYPSNPKTDFEFLSWVPTKFGEKSWENIGASRYANFIL